MSVTGSKSTLRIAPRLFVAALCVTAALTFVPNVSAQTHGLQERCGVMVEAATGLDFIEVQGFSVQAAELPIRAPPGYENVRSIMCGRPSLFIADNDYRVLMDLAMTLNITDGERVMVLEISEGQFRTRVIAGELTEAEAVAVQAALNRAQSLIQGDAP